MYSSSSISLGKLVLLVLAVGFTSSCGDPLGSDEDGRLGVIEFYGDPVAVSVPDTVLAGQLFSVSVTTYGNGCVSLGRTEVKTDSLSVDITPYDLHTGRYCEDILHIIDHTASISLAHSGTAQISFHGKQLPEDLQITEVREVVVR